MRFLKIVGSLQFAIALIAALVVLLTVSTSLESAYGTPFAQKTFYTALWFDALLGLVWLNIFSATLTRLPFKKRHIGFVVTHVGILTLLLGALFTRVFGVEGTLQLFEGEKRGVIAREGHAIEIALPGKAPVAVPLKSGRTRFPYDVETEGFRLRVLGAAEHAVEKRGVSEGDGAPNAAALVRLKSETLGMDETFWLIEREPSDHHAHIRNVGPAHVELRRNDDDFAVLVVSQPSSGRSVEMALRPAAPGAVALPGTELTVRNIRYYRHAKVVDEKIVDAPGSVRFNPAVEFEVADAAGRVEHHTRFLFFPQYGSLRGGAKADVFGLTVSFDATVPESVHPVPVPSLAFFASEKGWTARVTSSRKDPVEVPVKEGDAVETGWMDITAEVKRLVDRAKITRTVEPSTDGRGLFALRLAAGDGPARWVLAGSHAHLGGASVAVKSDEHVLPFELGLKDFRKVDYPGTTNPASFESDVVLMDAKDGVRIERTIKMNEPLDYKGWRVFQSSYMQDPEFGEGSVFSVAKNPGIPLIYGGAPVILAGVILLFYLHPFFGGRESATPSKTHRPQGGRHAR